jgi:hypothetical protein
VKRAAALAALLVLAGCGGDSGASEEPNLSEVEAMTLRLSDLPQGFRYGDDRGCGELGTTEGKEPELDRFLIAAEAPPRACLGDFTREWGGPPPLVQTALFLFDSFEDAERAWELRKMLFRSFARILLTTERGEGDAVAFDSEGLQRLGAGEAWRDGQLVAAVYEEGLAGAEGREFAASLAEKQRERIESPSSPGREEDREIGLEDPAISIPIYWLGREFAPEGLPKLELERGEHLSGDGPGNDVKIDYSGGGIVTLDLWRPEAWERFEHTRLGKLARCQARGRVRICRGRIGHWLAQVHEDGVVVAVNMPYCFACRRPADDPYNSRRAMEAVVAGLRRR